MSNDDQDTRNRSSERLKAVNLDRLNEPGTYIDGKGLYLRVTETGSKTWIYRYTSPTNGKRREMGLGAYGKRDVTLQAARDAAATVRAAIAQGVDPIDNKKRQKKERMKEAALDKKRQTFGAFADAWIEDNEASFRNEKHRAQWRMTMGHKDYSGPMKGKEYARPLREKLISEITADDVVAVLKPIWNTKPETAKRVQGRIERIMRAAGAKGHYAGPNPASWQDSLRDRGDLRSRSKLSRGHHAAMPFALLPEFIAELRKRSGVSALALEFLIHTAARSGEVRGMVWDEVDMQKCRWTVPAWRMKAKIEHRVPLNDRAMAILREMESLRPREGANNALVFPGNGPRQKNKDARGQTLPMSDMTLAAVLKRMKDAPVLVRALESAKVEAERRAKVVDVPFAAPTNITVHGFRSCFRGWAEEKSGHSYGVFKAALAHTNSDKTDAAYDRTDKYEQRVDLMDKWGRFLDGGAEASPEAGR